MKPVETRPNCLISVAMCMGFVDYISIVTALYCAFTIRLHLPVFPVQGDFKLEGIYHFFIVPAVFLAVFLLNGVYSEDVPYWERLKVIFRSITVGTITVVVLMYAGHVTGSVSRLFVAFSYACILIFDLIFRLIFDALLTRTRVIQIPVLLVGAGKTAELVERALQHMPAMYYKFIGYVDDAPKSSYIQAHYPCLGTLADAERVVRDMKIRHVLICIARHGPERVGGFNKSLTTFNSTSRFCS